VVNIAVAIPCYNEEKTIAKVVKDFQRTLPEAKIYVFDNNSSDQSGLLAKEAGAQVIKVYKQGKGHVMQKMFEVISCDVLICVDGDDTYAAEDAIKLMEPVIEGRADMVVGDRLKNADSKSLVQLHQVGNRLIVGFINLIFKTKFVDVLSGYRVFGRSFLENVPLITTGFETETELTLQALEADMYVVEIPIEYRARPKESVSKLRPFRDGFRIMRTISMILRDHYPLRLYGVISFACFLVAFVAGIIKLLPHEGIPETLLAGLILLFMPICVITLSMALILSAINTRLKEIRQLSKRRKYIE
jgi:glycosyltransferase involved in cell wall biosynthesis